MKKRILTLKQLQKIDICQESYDAFEERFGESLMLSVGCAKKLLRVFDLTLDIAPTYKRLVRKATQDKYRDRLWRLDATRLEARARIIRAYLADPDHSIANRRAYQKRARLSNKAAEILQTELLIQAYIEDKK